MLRREKRRKLASGLPVIAKRNLQRSAQWAGILGVARVGMDAAMVAAMDAAMDSSTGEEQCCHPNDQAPDVK